MESVDEGMSYLDYQMYAEYDEEHLWGWSRWKRYRQKKRCKSCNRAIDYLDKKPHCKRRIYAARIICLHGGKPISYCHKYDLDLPKPAVSWSVMAKQGRTWRC